MNIINGCKHYWAWRKAYWTKTCLAFKLILPVSCRGHPTKSGWQAFAISRPQCWGCLYLQLLTLRSDGFHMAIKHQQRKMPVDMIDRVASPTRFMIMRKIRCQGSADCWRRMRRNIMTGVLVSQEILLLAPCHLIHRAHPLITRDFILITGPKHHWDC